MTQSSCRYSLAKEQRLCFKTPDLSLASFVVFISDVNEESRGSYGCESEIIALLYQTPESCLSDVFLFILAFSKEVFLLSSFNSTGFRYLC